MDGNMKKQLPWWEKYTLILNESQGASVSDGA